MAKSLAQDREGAADPDLAREHFQDYDATNVETGSSCILNLRHRIRIHVMTLLADIGPRSGCASSR